MSEPSENPKRDWSKVRRKADRQVNVRLSTEELAQLEAITQRAGVSMAGYMKAATFNRPIPPASRRPNVDAVQLRQLLGLMGKLGSNANQIARAVNIGSLADYREARRSLESIDGQLMEMRAQLLAALCVEP